MKQLKTMKKAVKMLMPILGAALIFIACAEETFTNDSTNVSNNLTPASLDATEIKGTAYDGVNYITWTPVKNATQYRLYRDNRLVDVFSHGVALGGYDDLYYYDYASLSDESIKDGQKYTYTIVATGVQASRGTVTSGSNTTDFVMSDSDILGDSKASVTLTAKVPAVFSKVEAAKNVKAAYMNDIAYGKVLGIYFEKPEYIGAYVEFAHDETGSGVNIYDYLAYGYQGERETGVPLAPKRYFNQVGQYTWTPAYGGKYKFRVVTSWANSFYQSNDVSGDIEIPSQEADVPQLTAASVTGGIKLTFTDKERASYTLYRAEDTDAAAPWSFTRIASDTDFAKTECGGGDVDYKFIDTGVDYDHYYVYILTAVKDDKALNFNSSAPAVAFAHYDKAITWNPQFAAINIAGTVSLSWNVEAGITYKVLKCTIDTDTLGTETSHTEEYLTVNASAVSAAVNKVYVMTDNIVRRDNSGYYKYTLIGTDDAGAAGRANDPVTGYNTTSTTFDLEVVGGLETDGNGIYDKVKITLTADNGINMSNVKFYRAEVDTDNKPTSAGAYTEFVTGYSAVTLTLTDTADNGDGKTKTYTYTDNSLTEALIANKAYAYAAAVTYNGTDLGDVDVCDLCNGALRIPNVVCNLKKSEGTDYNTYVDTYTLSWNAEYINTIGGATTARDPQAAVITVSYAYSNATAIDDVTETWTTKTVSAADFTDATYVQELVIGKDQKSYQYLYYKVLFANKQYYEANDSCPIYANYLNNMLPNPAYQTTAESEITAIIGTGATELYTTNTAHTQACIIKTNGTLAANEYTVYVTWLTNSAIYEKPIKINTLTLVPNDSGNNNGGNSYYLDTDKNCFYFTQKPSDDTNVTRALVHVTNSQGKTLRSVIITANKWW